MTGGARRCVPWLLALAGYISLTLVGTWPLPLRLATTVPHDAGDPLLTAWILAWNARTVPLAAQWWNAPMFWPMSGALILSEHMLGLSIVGSPLQWLGADPIVTYNGLFLLSFPLCAIAAHALAYSVTERHDGATLAGIVFAFNPYRLSRISHLHILWAFWMPLALMALHRYARSGDRRWLALFVAMWIGQALSNGYFMLFFPILIGMWIGWFMVWRHAGRRLRAVAVAWGLGTIALLPLVVPYSHLRDRFALDRGINEIRAFSADMRALVAAPPLVPASAIFPSTGNAEQQLFPGVTIPILMLAAAITSFRRTAPPRRWPQLSVAFSLMACVAGAVALAERLVGPWRVGIDGRTLVSVGTMAKPITVTLWCAILAIACSGRFVRAWTECSAFAFYAAAAVVMYAFSFGPDPTFFGTPFWYKPPYAWLMELPGFSTVRAPARFAMLAELCLSVAAAIALVRVRQRLPRGISTGLAIAVLAGAVADGWIRELPLPHLPPRAGTLETIRAGGVVELPLGSVESDIAALYRSIYHRRPVVNGYSGFVPVHYRVLRIALDAGDSEALGAIAVGGPLTVLDAQGHLTTIPAAAREESAPAGRVLGIRAATIDDRVIDATVMTDGDPLSRWDSGLPQQGNESITFDLGSIEDVDGVTLSIGQALGDYPRELTIETSEDLQVWSQQWSGRGASKAVAGALKDPATVPLAFGFRPTRARWIRLRQLGIDPLFHWSIAEVTVSGR